MKSLVMMHSPARCVCALRRAYARLALPRIVRALWITAGALLLLSSTGCVGIVYSANALSAEAKLEEAKTLGAEKLAEYEYFYAKAMLEKAKEEAADASYGDAIDFASIADEYAEKAIEHARNAHREAGR